MLVVNSAVPANNLNELVNLARQKPGSLSYASYGPGSQPQLATEMLKQKTKTFIVHIPYRGIPQAVMAVVGNEVPMTWSGIPSARAHRSMPMSGSACSRQQPRRRPPCRRSTVTPWP